MRRLIAGAAAAAAVAVAGLVALAGPAAAAETAGSPAVITQDTMGYRAPTKEAPPVMTGLAQGQQVTALCFTDEGAKVNGSPYWFRIKTATPESITAFVPRDVINIGGANLPNCFSN